MHYPFHLLPLPYGYTDLLPAVDPNSLFLHHGKLLRDHASSLNDLLARYPQYQDWTLEQLLTGRLLMPETDRLRILNDAGAIFSHQLYFGRMRPRSAVPASGPLYQAISGQYGSLTTFRHLFQQAAASLFGVGWVWLNTDASGQLHIAVTRDNETPSLHAFTPLLVLDMWEHAYLARFPGDINAYVDSWFRLIDWPAANAAYQQAQTSPAQNTARR